MPAISIVKQSLVLGTRGSALALAQVNLTEAALRRAFADLEVHVKKITTSGDRRSDFSDAYRSGAGVKGLFTREIEQALLDGSIDVAVHSCKDLPGRSAAGLVVGAVLERADTADVFIGCESFATLAPGAAVGTSSVRRSRQILHLRPDLRVEEMRGNVPTRLEKLRASGTLAGIVLARAGLDRLGIDLDGWHVETLPMLPAVGQGAIALQCRADDAETARLLAAINHGPTFACVAAERELLRLLNGDCNLPVGVETKLEEGMLSMRSIIFGDEGVPPFTGSVSGAAAAPGEIAAKLFEKIQSHAR